MFTKNVPASALRGFGAMQVVLGHESQIDALAGAVRMDQREIRDLNYVQKGDAGRLR